MGEVLEHPTRENSPEAVLAEAVSTVEKLREGGEVPFVMVLVGSDLRVPMVYHTAMFDRDYASCAQIAQAMCQARFARYCLLPGDK